MLLFLLLSSTALRKTGLLRKIQGLMPRNDVSISVLPSLFHVTRKQNFSVFLSTVIISQHIACTKRAICYQISSRYEGYVHLSLSVFIFTGYKNRSCDEALEFVFWLSSLYTHHTRVFNTFNCNHFQFHFPWCSLTLITKLTKSRDRRIA